MTNQKELYHQKLSSKIYNLELIKNIQDDKKNMTRFLIMGKDIYQPEFKKQNNM